MGHYDDIREADEERQNKELAAALRKRAPLLFQTVEFHKAMQELRQEYDNMALTKEQYQLIDQIIVRYFNGMVFR